MRTVRVTLALTVALLIAIPVMAQDKKAPGKGKRVKLTATAQIMLRMTKVQSAMKEIELTDEQTEKVGEVGKELFPKIGEAFGKLKEILTEEQQTATEEAMRKAKDDGKEGRAFMLAVQSSIKVTDEQTKKMDAVAKELSTLHRQFMKKALGIMTPDQKAELKKKLAPPARKKGKPGQKKAKAAEKKVE